MLQDVIKIVISAFFFFFVGGRFAPHSWPLKRPVGPENPISSSSIVVNFNFLSLSIPKKKKNCLFSQIAFLCVKTLRSHFCPFFSLSLIILPHNIVHTQPSKRIAMCVHSRTHVRVCLPIAVVLDRCAENSPSFALHLTL